MKSTKFQSEIKAKGIHTINLFRIESQRARILEQRIQEITRKRAALISLQKTGIEVGQKLAELREMFQFIKEEMTKNFLVRQYIVENITTTVGRQVAAQVLAGTYGSTGAVTHTAVGDDNTSPTVGDTTLGNETSRRALTDGNTTGVQTLLETFFLTSEAVDTHEEFGMFIDGTASADTGVLFNRFTQTVVKSNTESMNVQSTITWSDA